MAKWMVAAKKADFNKIAATYGITPVAARILRNRDVVLDKDIQMFLSGTISDLHDPFLMLHMEEAVSLLQQKIHSGAKIRVIGDYDVDGICSTYILCHALESCQARVDRVIPHRVRDGYGLNVNLIEEAHQNGIDTILTCDNGIAALEEIALAKSYGMTVIVTDHHEVPYEENGGEKRFLLPPADVILDPKQEGETYPYAGICGAVVAYKLIEALLDRLSLEDDTLISVKKELEEALLPFAALATVCDVMELLDENRLIVKYGLQKMAQTENVGLRALLQVQELAGKELSAYHLGFILGPSLNATGRLDSALRALSLFEEKSVREAIEIASDLKSLNDSRKQMTEEGVEKALLQIAGFEDKVLVVYLPDCHESIAGIIAGRIKERCHKPTFVLTRSEEGVKGSGRSIEGYSMYEELTKVKELFTRFGGHKMAAGISLPDEASVAELRRRLNENCTLTEDDFEETIHIDVPMPMYYADRSFIQELSLLEPFGNGNPKPLFAEKNMKIVSSRILGKNRNVGKYVVRDERGQTFDMIYFGDVQKFQEFFSAKETISIAYYPGINSYMGKERIQMVMQYYC